MSRIHKAFEIRFRTLLVKVNARRLEAGVTKLMQRAYQRTADLGISRPQALLDVYSQVSQRPAFRQEFALPVPVKFACDCGLGGLTRWLRAAGYEASWQSHISDDALLKCTLQSRSVLLTTDSLLMERTPLRTGQVPALWLPPSFSPQRQLESVLAHFRLPLLPHAAWLAAASWPQSQRRATVTKYPRVLMAGETSSFSADTAAGSSGTAPIGRGSGRNSSAPRQFAE